ncbi:MAG: BA14K family protein, partial [Candidatus Dadabacteria bacterium]
MPHQDDAPVGGRGPDGPRRGGGARGRGVGGPPARGTGRPGGGGPAAAGAV